MDTPPPPPPPPPPTPTQSSPPVNWDALDALVLDFARSDRLLLPSASPSPPSSPSSSSTTTATSSSSSAPSPSSSYRSRLLIRRARTALEEGDVDAALALLRAHAPAALLDHRLLFHLHKQRFVELVRRGTEADREAALDCLRTALAPCALDAYPWSIKKRFELAGLLSSILRTHLQAYDPILSMTLRIHKLLCSRQGISSPISNLTERLLFDDRDPPAVDVQALAHAVELTRQGAVDSLKFAKGDLFQAFQNELCRMKLDLPLLDKLIHEYCIYRGIVEGGSHVLPGLQSNNQSNDVNFVDKQEDSTETRIDFEMTNNQNGNCSTSDTSHHDSWSRRLRRVRSSASGQRRRKRWRGRVDDLDYGCETPLDANKHAILCSALDMDEDDMIVKPDLMADTGLPDSRCNQDQKYEVILEMRDLTRKGMASKVVEEINNMDPDFFLKNPILLFQLKQVEFLKLVASGDHGAALKVASTHLGPLAASNQALLKPLKETLVTLIQPCEDVLTKSVSLPVLASSLQIAMSRRLGIEEPQLMKIIRTTLHTHSEWFKLQMCKDRFEHFLKIDSLKEVDPSAGSHNMSKVLTDECANGSSQITTCSSGKVLDEGSSPQESSEVTCDENAILKVMEFLALPRADAIQLLMQYGGNAEAVIQQIFSKSPDKSYITSTYAQLPVRHHLVTPAGDDMSFVWLRRFRAMAAAAYSVALCAVFMAVTTARQPRAA
uniref:CTLH domain-containing protein n=1 Tax=Oryza meridionalis TaxID=40149 RepID=A0A0E0EX59_9ORYZ